MCADLLDFVAIDCRATEVVRLNRARSLGHTELVTGKVSRYVETPENRPKRLSSLTPLSDSVRVHSCRAASSILTHGEGKYVVQIAGVRH